MRYAILLRLATCLLVYCSNVHATVPPSGFADVVEPLMQTVVNVYTKSCARSYNMSFRISKHFPLEQFRDFFEQFELLPNENDLRSANSKASGFIIDQDGYIVTNNHVVEDASEIFVKLGDGAEFKANLIGSDKRTDLALLKINANKSLPFVQFGDSSKVRVGDWVIAIGNPFGLGGTVTAGIISSRSRDISFTESSVVDDFLQTDAAINVGNSGGPLFNTDGEVVGVNTAIFAPGDLNTNIGIGFAIPSSTVTNVIEQLKSSGKVSRGLLNIKIQELTKEIAEGLGIDDVSGTLVFDVEPGGAGDKAGLKQGDVITEFNNEQIRNARKLQIAVAATPVNTVAKMVVVRNGKKHELQCTITDNDDEPEIAKKSRAKAANELSQNGESLTKHGVVFSEISGKLAKSYNIPKDYGVIVSDSVGILNVGDVIISANQQPVSTIKELDQVFRDAIKIGRKNVVLLVKRYTRTIFVAMPL